MGATKQPLHKLNKSTKYNDRIEFQDTKFWLLAKILPWHQTVLKFTPSLTCLISVCFLRACQAVMMTSVVEVQACFRTFYQRVSTIKPKMKPLASFKDGVFMFIKGLRSSLMPKYFTCSFVFLFLAMGNHSYTQYFWLLGICTAYFPLFERQIILACVFIVNMGLVGMKFTSFGNMRDIVCIWSLACSINTI